MVKICISDINKYKLKTNLKTIRILGDALSTNSIKSMISISSKPDSVQFRINIIANDNNKAKILHIYKDNIFLFIYNMKNTTLGEISNSGLCDVSNFWPRTKIDIE